MIPPWGSGQSRSRLWYIFVNSLPISLVRKSYITWLSDQRQPLAALEIAFQVGKKTDLPHVFWWLASESINHFERSVEMSPRITMHGVLSWRIFFVREFVCWRGSWLSSQGGWTTSSQYIAFSWRGPWFLCPCQIWELGIDYKVPSCDR